MRSGDMSISSQFPIIIKGGEQKMVQFLDSHRFQHQNIQLNKHKTL